VISIANVNRFHTKYNIKQTDFHCISLDIGGWSQYLSPYYWLSFVATVLGRILKLLGKVLGLFVRVQVALACSVDELPQHWWLNPNAEVDFVPLSATLLSRCVTPRRLPRPQPKPAVRRPTLEVSTAKDIGGKEKTAAGIHPVGGTAAFPSSA